MMIGLKFNINDGECSTKSYFNLKVILFSLSKFSYILKSYQLFVINSIEIVLL